MTPYLTCIFLTLAIVAASLAVAAFQGRKARRQAIEKALYPEVISLRFQAGAMAAELARRHRKGAPLDEVFFSQWRLSIPLVYPAVGQGLGLLPAVALDRIGYFHAQLADARERIGEARASGGNVQSVYRLLSNLVRAWNHVEPWVREKEPRFGPIIGGYPDISEAHGLLELLEEKMSEPRARPWCWADCADVLEDG